MIANAILITIAVMLGVAFYLMGELRFFIPFKAVIWRAYSRLSEDSDYRRMVAEQTGLGFALPTTLIPMIPKTVEQETVEVQC
jgi:hypothetical protein